MKTTLTTAVMLTVAALAFSTGSVKAESTMSVGAALVALPAQDLWTWTDFGGQVIGWAAGGAAGGAVECALVGTPVGALCGAAVGGAAGTAAGAGYYAGTQAWNYFFGRNKENLVVPATTLD